MDKQIERDQSFESALLCSPRFNESDDPLVNRQAAVDWGVKAYVDDLIEPFTPSGSGALDAGFWPAQDGGLIELTDKGRLPEDANLEFGVTILGTEFYGIRRLDDGSFIAVVSGNVTYAKKVGDSGSEPTEAEDTIATTDG